MKLFVRLMALILVLALAGPFFIKGPDGNPLMTVSGVRQGAETQWRRLKGDLGQAVGNENAGKVEMVRWQDASGQWHFGDDAPEGVAAEKIYVDPDASRMDPIKIRPRRREQQADSVVDGPIVNPLRAREIMDEVTATRDQLDQRQQALQDRLEEAR